MREASLEQSLLVEYCQLIANTQKKKKNIYIYIYRMAKFIRVCQYNVALNPDDLFGQPIIYIYIYRKRPASLLPL